MLEGKGPSPPSHPQGPHREEGRGRFSPSPLLPQNCIIKIPIQSSHGGGERKRKTENPTLDPTRLTATDGDIWQEGGGARKFL